MRSSPFALLEGLIAPAPPARRVAFLKADAFAHRGLHGDGRIENSRAAAAAAIDAGYGVECDVRVSRDGVVFLFHDDALDRVAGVPGAIEDQPAAAIDRLRLGGGDEAPPRLTELLALVSGRAPLLIELKPRLAQIAPLCMAVMRTLEGYPGAAAVMAFEPGVSRWFAAHAPRIARGLVVSERRAKGWRGAVRRQIDIWRAKPDFLAWDVRDLPSRLAARQRRRGLPVLAWTVRDAAGEALGLAHADQIVFERT